MLRLKTPILISAGLLGSVCSVQADCAITVAGSNVVLPGVNCSTTQMGAQSHHLYSAATTNATQVKVGPGTLYSMVLVNPTAKLAYLKLVDRSGAPNCTSDPVKWNIPIPFSTGGGGVALDLDEGLAFNFGIAYCLVGGGADNDATAGPAGVTVNLGYK